MEPSTSIEICFRFVWKFRSHSGQKKCVAAKMFQLRIVSNFGHVTAGAHIGEKNDLQIGAISEIQTV